MEPALPRLLLAGLGNIPYPNTRHSLGHVVIDALANRWRISFKKNALGWSGQSTVRLSGARSVSIVLFKPDKLMNISGPPIAQAAKQADHLFVLHDFTARKIGHIGVIRDAPPGSHNGLKSVKQAYQKPFWSVRLGIGHPGPGADLADYVLGKLSPSELDFWQAEGAALVAESLEVAFGKAVGGEGKDGARNLTFRPQSPRERP